MMDTSQNTSTEKKGTLEGLDREELIRKCKGLLGIAQKAKKAKDDLSNELTALKEKLTECDTQKQADKEGLKTMQFMIDTLTENKLSAANQIADLQKSNKTLLQQVGNCTEKLSKLEALEIENEAQKKQIKRLTEENEEQEMDLRKLDERLGKVSELSKRQKQELLLLEQSVDRWKAMENAYLKLEQENKELQAKLAEKASEVAPTPVEDDDSEKIDIMKEQLQHENEQLKKENGEQKSKLKKYKLKVIEFSHKLEEVKESKKLLQQTVAEYSKSVSKWHIQISHASKLLVKEVNELNSAKSDLEERLAVSEFTVKDLQGTVDELKSRLENIQTAEAGEATVANEFKEKYEKSMNECESLKTELQARTFEIGVLTNKLDTLRGTNEKQLNEIGNLEKIVEIKESKIEDLGKSFLEQETRFGDVTAKASEFEAKYEVLLEDYKSMEADLRSKNAEINSICSEWSTLATTLKNESVNDRSEIANLKQFVENKDLKIENLEKSITELESRLVDETSRTTTKTNISKDEYEALLKDYKSIEAVLKSKIVEFEAITGERATFAASLQDEIEMKRLEVENLKKQLEMSNAMVHSLRENIKEMKFRLEEVSTNSAADANGFKEKIETLKNEYKSFEADLQSQNMELVALSSEKDTLIASLKEKTEKQLCELEEQNKALEANSRLMSELEEKEKSANSKNEELLAEMRELNEILKTRGNLISTQTAEADQLKSKLQEQSNQIAQLEENLKEKIKQINQFETQSEIMSTSTISRADEIARMRDVEDSFEEKYNKLRALAVKLKKKVAEQQVTITKLEQSQTVSPDTSNSTSINMQNLKSLQIDNDRLQDKIDNMTIERKKYKAEIEELNQMKRNFEEELKSLKIVNEDIKAAADTNHKIKSALDEQIKSGEKQIEALKNDNRNVVQQLKNAENELVKMKDQIKQKESEIGGKVEEIFKLKSDLNKLQNSMKKSNVLSLEVEAYEKSLKELSEKLDSHVKQLTEAKNENEKLTEIIQTLRNDILKLKNELDLEKQNSTDLQQHNDMQKIKLKENIVEISELKRIIDDHVKELNTIKIELANLQSQQSENEVEKQKFISRLKSENEKNVSQLFSLEEEVRSLKLKLSGCEQELVNVQTEFASYKVRAQSVLRQNQAKDSSNEEELKEELILMQQTRDDLMAKLKHSNEQQNHLQQAIDELKGEKQNLQERSKKLLQLVEETRQQTESIQNENRKQTQEHQEALKTHRLQIDTLNNCFKKQLEDMQRKYEEEVASLKAANAVKSVEIEESSQRAKHLPLSDEQRIELIMMERQAGEGSECTTSLQTRKMSNSSRNKRELIPLDELLNNSFDEPTETTEFETEEDTVTKEKIAVQQSRVKHLSSLLSEAEMDVARLTEMNSMLKEELRRQERSTEREKHMHNLEYMKNVIFKFLTINNADERAHLVPVLNIILKLSPDESKQLQNVARGNDGGPSGWSNILPSVW